VSYEASAFEWSESQLREAWQLFGVEIERWWRELPGQPPAGRTLAKRKAQATNSPLPESGQDLVRALDELRSRLAGDAQVVGHPGYLAYVAGAANPLAPMAQAFAMMMNPYTGTFATAPACVELEDEALSWIKQMVAWPADSLGWITTGSSLAILSAVIAARESKKALVGSRRLYVSDLAHHCVGKAAFAAGFLPEEVRILPHREGRLCVTRLENAVQEDKQAGRVPVMVVATAGSTNIGRVDPLGALADLCQREGLWYHIDGAYGGFFRVLREIACLEGLERADSLSLDPHKALCMPYGTGILLCKKAEHLRWPRGMNASYMPPLDPEELRFEYSDISPELSRDFRGLRLWLSLKVFGLSAYRRHLEERYHLAQELAFRIGQHPQLELLSPADLSLFAWAIRGDLAGTTTQALLASIHASGRFFMTSCHYQDRFAIRTCILGFRFHRQELEQLWAEIEQALLRIRA
jgi:aromatic-L-amino-acid decarboxylase